MTGLDYGVLSLGDLVDMYSGLSCLNTHLSRDLPSLGVPVHRAQNFHALPVVSKRLGSTGGTAPIGDTLGGSVLSNNHLGNHVDVYQCFRRCSWFIPNEYKQVPEPHPRQLLGPEY